MDIKTIGIVGAGQMGNGIAQVAGSSGFQVIMSDIAEAFVQKGLGTITKNLERLVEKGKLASQKKEEILGRIRGTIQLDGMAEADFVVEAATENESLKLGLFKNLDQICRKDVILSSNTSSISITKIASATQRSSQVIGMHFMNPVPVMQLVEIIKGLQTSPVTFNTVKSLTEKMGKTPVEANDFPGFISNRILMPMINEAIYALFEGVGTPEAIDTVMTSSGSIPAWLLWRCFIRASEIRSIAPALFFANMWIRVTSAGKPEGDSIHTDRWTSH
jgi:3-hydroxybutyryl-CoA dehydrogenase